MQMLSPPVLLQRARGRAEVAFSHRDGAVRLDRLYQQGCAKALLPRTLHGAPDVVLINTSGGLTGDDRLDYALGAGPGARVAATTQAAERIYRASFGTARTTVRLTLGAGATLDWLPQETILFDGGRIERRLDADMAETATMTVLETLVLGRAAMGEALATGHYADHWRIRRDGRLIHAEALRLTGDLAAAAAGRATFGGARALATLVHIAPDPEAALARARAVLAPGRAASHAVEAAASLRAGVVILRFLAPDHAPLRRALAAFLTAFRDAPLPRVWSL